MAKDALKGIEMWLNSVWLSGAGKDTAYSTRNQRIIERFYTDVLLLSVPVKFRYSKMADCISKLHWSEFVKWVKKNYTG